MSKLAFLFILTFFCLIFASFMIAPYLSAIAYTMVYFINPEIRWWFTSIPSLPYSFIASFTMILVLVANHRTLGPQAPWRKQPIFKWILSILACYFVMINFAVVPESHLRFTDYFLRTIAVVFLAYKLISSERALHACLWAYILGATYISYIALSVGRNWQGRVENIGMVDTGGDSNMTAASLAPSLILLTYYAWLGNNKTKILALIFGGLIVNGLVLINSRGAFLGTAVGSTYFLCYMIFSKYQRAGQRGIAIFVILTAIAGSLYVADDVFLERIGTLTELEDGMKSGSHRIDYWFATFDMMEDYPIGVGIHGFTALSKNYLPAKYFEGRSIGRAVHSTWFQVISEIGWIGLFFFIALILSTFSISRKTKIYLLSKKNYTIYFKIIALEGSLITFLVAATFIDRARAVTLYWLILYIAIASNLYYLRFQHQLSTKSNSMDSRPKEDS